MRARSSHRPKAERQLRSSSGKTPVEKMHIDNGPNAQVLEAEAALSTISTKGTSGRSKATRNHMALSAWSVEKRNSERTLPDRLQCTGGEIERVHNAICHGVCNQLLW